MDVCRRKDGKIPMKKEEMPNEDDKEHIPLYCVNNDIVAALGYSMPRLVFGSFTLCLINLCKTAIKKDIKLNYYGKPFAATFEYT